MKILIVPDIPDWAIGKLAQAKVKFNPHHQFKVVYLHPRDAGVASKQKDFEATVNEFKPDVIHFEYFRTCSQVLTALPFLKKYKIILTHHNQRKRKALLSADWKELGVDCLVAHTEKTAKILREESKHPNVKVIKHGIDLDFFEYSEDEPKEFTVGYAGRIVPWKRFKEVAEACLELKIPLMFMGRPDKADYWDSVSEDAKRNVNYSFMKCEDSDRLDYYNSISCFANFSDDDYEEGTLEYFEAMACGAPVITTVNGSAADLAEDRKNALVVPFGDKEALKEAILELKNDDELRKTLKRNAWELVKNYPEQKMAYQYSKLYHEVFMPDHPLVSVILPTFNRTEQVIKILNSIKEQTHPHCEVVIGDDGSGSEFKEAVKEWRANNPEVTIKLAITNNAVLRGYNEEYYGLAEARNRAVVEAEGDYLVFIDSRIMPDENAIMMFKQAIDGAKDTTEEDSPKVWFFGSKGTNKKSFVENFSAVARHHFVRAGMFCERIDKYGGMSQEIRSRWSAQGGDFYFIKEAKATQILSSKKGIPRRKDIVNMKFLLHKLYN